MCRRKTLALMTCSLLSAAVAMSGCSTSSPRLNAAVTSPAASSTVPSLATSASTSPPATQPDDADLGPDGKVDLAKFLVPAQTHGPKDVDCEVLFGTGAAVERATSFAAMAMGADYTLESYAELPAGTTFSPLSSNKPGVCVYGLVRPGFDPEGEVWFSMTRDGSPLPTLVNDAVLPLFAARQVSRSGLRISIQTSASAQVDLMHTGSLLPADPASVQHLLDYVVASVQAHAL